MAITKEGKPFLLIGSFQTHSKEKIHTAYSNLFKKHFFTRVTKCLKDNKQNSPYSAYSFQ